MTGTETYQKVPAGWLSLKTGVLNGFGDPPPPPAQTGKLIGIYMSGSNSGLDALTSSWPTKPNLASFYMGWNVTIASTAKIAQYANEGRVIQMELATRTGTSSYVLWSDIAAGVHDAHIINFINTADNLGTRVMLSLDNEPELKATSGTGEVAPGQTAAQYKAAANRFADLIHANATNVESLMWYASGNTSGAINWMPTVTKLDNVGWDPYKRGDHPVSETATQLFATFINNVLIPNGYGSVKRHILETGIKVDAFSNGGSFDVPTQIAFYRGFPAAMDALSIESIIWFRANSGAHDYIPLDSSVDDAFRDMLDAAIG